MHKNLYAKYQKLVLRSVKTGKGAKDVEAAPRGNAKSTLASLILPIWCIVGDRRRFIAIVSETSQQAEEFLEFIKAELEVNDRLREDFPGACGAGRIWKQGQIITRNDVKVKRWGKRKRMRGARHGNRRPDLVICDDLEGDENIEELSRNSAQGDFINRDPLIDFYPAEMLADLVNARAPIQQAANFFAAPGTSI